jgi:hypothetical protein
MHDDQDTEFEAAFLEGAEDQGQPGADTATGRPAKGEGDGSDDFGGEDADPGNRAAAPAVRALNAKIEELQKDGSRRAELQQAEADRDREVFLGKQRSILEAKHPDWQEVARTDTSYAAWAMSQPDWVQDLIRRNAQALVDGEAATFVFDKFRAETKAAVDPHEQRRERQLEGSTHIPPRTPAFEPRSKGGSGDYNSEWEIAKREEQQERDRAARAAARR